MIDRLFLQHPREAGESYLHHMGVAFGTGAKMLGGGLACFAHGLLPSVFTTTGSDTIRGLHAKLGPRRSRCAEAQKASDADVAAGI